MSDYRQHLSRIQFLEQSILPHRLQTELTVDFVFKKIIDTVIDNTERTAKSQYVDFPEDISELISLSTYENFIEWIDCEPQRESSYGYRDGWNLLCFLTPYGDDHSIVYSMTEYYKDSPFEMLLSWLKCFAPEIVPNW